MTSQAPAASPAADRRSSERTLESLSLAIGAGAFVVVAFVAIIVFRFQSAPMKVERRTFSSLPSA